MSRLLLEIYPESTEAPPGTQPLPPILICAPNGRDSQPMGSASASSAAQPVVLRIHDGGCAIQHGSPSQPTGPNEAMGLGQWHEAEGWRFRVTHAVQAEGDGSVGDNPSWAAPEIRITTYETDRVRRLRCMLPVEEGSQLVIGRGGTGTDLIVEDEHVSRVHLRFFVREVARLVEDMGSRWGTKLNGESLTDPKPLRHGDEIRLGKSTIHYICYWDILPEGPKNPAVLSAAPPNSQIPPPEVPPVPPPPAAPAKPPADEVKLVPTAAINPDKAKIASLATTKLTPPTPVPPAPPATAKKPAAKRNYLGFDVGGAILIVLLVLAGLVYLGYLIHKL